MLGNILRENCASATKQLKLSIKDLVESEWGQLREHLIFVSKWPSNSAFWRYPKELLVEGKKTQFEIFKLIIKEKCAIEEISVSEHVEGQGFVFSW